jgi:glyoxylase-like metal-dependent hydrolase (beta-lactamase superfamily II)
MHETTTHARARQINSHLWLVGGGSWNGAVNAVSDEGDANVYLLAANGTRTLIDCGGIAGRGQIEANLRGVGVEPDTLEELLLTHSHWDHTEAAHAWQTSYGLRTHLNAVGAELLARGDHRLVGAPLLDPDYVFSPFAVDHAVEDGEAFQLSGIDVTAKFLPGHTLDSTLYTFDLDSVRVAVCGDIAFGKNEVGTYSLGWLSDLWGSNLDVYVASLRTLEQIPIDLLVPGHGAPVVGRDPVREAVEGALVTAEGLAGNPAVRRNTGF